MAAPCVGSLMAHCVPASLSGALRPVEDALPSWVVLHQLCLHSEDEIGMPEESAENGAGSQELAEMPGCCRLHICCTLG